MRERRSEKYAPTPWHSPSRSKMSPKPVRTSISRRMRRSAPQWREWRACAICLAWEANFDVTRRGAGLRVAGGVPATVGQLCVMLEPLVTEVEEAIDLLFVPQPTAEREDGEVGTRGESANETEPLIGGLVDLGALAIEFLILGLDPYPRKPGAVFQPPPPAKPDETPFAALASLRKGPDDH